jgi:hypothetical protein
MSADTLIKLCVAKGYSITIKNYVTEAPFKIDPFVGVFIDTKGQLKQPTAGFQIYAGTLDEAISDASRVLFEASRGEVV